MAIAQAMCTAFKQELMLGTHNFATNGNAFKLALYAESSGGKSSTTATLGATTTAFTTTGEVASSGTLIYNSTNSNKAVAVLDFSSNKTSTSGTFTIQFPTADASNAIIRIA